MLHAAISRNIIHTTIVKRKGFIDTSNHFDPIAHPYRKVAKLADSQIKANILNDCSVHHDDNDLPNIRDSSTQAFLLLI